MKKTLYLISLLFLVQILNAQNICIDKSLSKPDIIHQPNLALLKSNVWKPGQTLTVKFLDGNSFVQEKVKKYAQNWSIYANIIFNFVNNGNADIRISFIANNGSWSYIGKDALAIPQNKATMNFGWFNNSTTDSDFMCTTLHEFGHALGAIHEHQHPGNGIPWDKPVVYAYYMNPPNNWSKSKVDDNLFAKYSVSQTLKGQYDKYSIMHYPIPNEHTIGDYSVGWNTNLSLLDKEYIGQVYPFNYETKIHFKTVAAAENGVFFAVDYEGKMRWYKYIGINGEEKWAVGSGNVISRGWNSFKYILAGTNGMIFAIALNGDMYWYKYTGTNGQESWEVGSKTVISGGWESFKDILTGQDNEFFAISKNGDMFWYKYTGNKGEHTWEVGSKSVIGRGWDSFSKTFVDKSNNIYGITKEGKLVWYKYIGKNGSTEFANGSGNILGGGWESFHNVVAGSKGNIFAITMNGNLTFYKDNGTFGTINWGTGTGQVISRGW